MPSCSCPSNGGSLSLLATAELTSASAFLRSATTSPVLDARSRSPVVKRQNEALALGFVTTRLLEAAVIMIGVVSLLAVVTLWQDLAGTDGTDPAAAVMVGAALVAVRDWTFLLGPGVMPALNALLGTLMYRSRLVPRAVPMMGLIGAPLLLAGTTATLLGHVAQGPPIAALAALPVAAWELSLGIYMVAKGFKPSSITPSVDPAAAGRPVPEARPVG